MKYYILQNKEMPWGDYGNILGYGLLTVIDDDYNDLEVHKIERVGINIPEIYTANATNLVASQDIVDIIKTSNIKGIKKLHNTEFTKIVNVDWINWDFSAKDPLIYPKSGEPIDYIEEGLNDENLNSKIQKKYFSLDLETQSKVTFKDEKRLIKTLDYLPQFDLFKAGKGYIIISEKFKTILDNMKIISLKFLPIEVETS